MRVVLFIIGLIVVGACASTRTANRSSVLITYQTSDSPAQQRINLSYRNMSPHAICIGPENWPSSGVLLNPGNNVYIETGGKRFFLNAEQDYCPKCRRRVAKGEIITDFLHYDSFGLPPDLHMTPKTLSFKSIGIVCK